MATIIIRQNSPSWDPLRGAGAANFISDIDAVAQIIEQRLRLLQGEWFANISIGTPMFQSILGVARTSQGISLILREQILAAPYVTGLQNFSVVYSAPGRTFSVSGIVNTVFGNLALNFQPYPALQASIP